MSGGGNGLYCSRFRARTRLIAASVTAAFFPCYTLANLAYPSLIGGHNTVAGVHFVARLLRRLARSALRAVAVNDVIPVRFGVDYWSYDGS